MTFEMNKIYEMLARGEGEFNGEVSSSLIELAEQKLDLTFPPSYCAFLKKFGCGDLNGFEIYGIIDDDFENSSVPDAVWLTLQERKQGLQHQYIIISDSGDGGFYAIDTSKHGPAGENPIILLDPNGNTEFVSRCFATFLSEYMSASL